MLLINSCLHKYSTFQLNKAHVNFIPHLYNMEICPNRKNIWDSKMFILNKFHVYIYSIYINISTRYEICGITAWKNKNRLKCLLSKGSAGDFMVSKELSLNLDFSFLNRIFLLLISTSYPVVLKRLGGPCSKSYIPRKISGRWDNWDCS